MRKLLCLLLLITSIVCYGQSNDSIVTIRGQVVDRSGASLPYVNISVKGNHATNGNELQSKNNGLFSFHVKKSDEEHCSAAFSYIGFKTKTVALHPVRDINLGCIVLDEDTMELEGVEIKGNLVYHDKEKSSYLPSVRQKKTAYNAFGLLYNLMIPELKIDRRTKSIRTQDEKNVAQCINGHEATSLEIKSLRARDIIRIDYYPKATGKFANYDAVVDYIVKVVDEGGYINATGSMSFLTPAEGLDVNVKYHKKNWDLYSYVGANYADNNKYHLDGQEDVETQQLNFTKLTSTDHYKNKANNQYVALQGIYQDDKNYLNIVGGLSRTNNYKQDEFNRTVYMLTPGTYEKRDSSVRPSRGLMPYAQLTYEVNLPKKVYLLFYGTYSFIHNNYDRRYHESDSDPIINNAKEDGHLSQLYVRGTKKFGNYGDLTVGYILRNDRYKDDYSGSVDYSRKYMSTSHLVWARLGSAVGKKIYAQLKASLKFIHTSINEYRDNQTTFSPELYLGYNIDNTTRLTLENNIGYLVPNNALRSELEQKISNYEILRGNVDLKNYIYYNPVLTLSKNFNIINMSASVGSMIYSHSVQDVYFGEGDKLVHTFKKGDRYVQSKAEIAMTGYLLNRSLQIMGTLSYLAMNTNDDFRKSINNWTYGFNAMYMIGNFSVSSFFMSRIKSSDVMSSLYAENPATYGLSMSYNKGNWYLSLDYNNPFRRNPLSHGYLNSNCYKKSMKLRDSSFCQSITLKVNYNFDFGHKKVEHKEVRVDKNISNSLLK